MKGESSSENNSERNKATSQQETEQDQSKKRHPSVEVQWRIEVRGKDSCIYEGDSLNLSVAGMLFQIPTELEVGESVALTLHAELDYQKLLMQFIAKVVYCTKKEESDNYLIGVQFTKRLTRTKHLPTLIESLRNIIP